AAAGTDRNFHHQITLVARQVVIGQRPDFAGGDGTHQVVGGEVDVAAVSNGLPPAARGAERRGGDAAEPPGGEAPQGKRAKTVGQPGQDVFKSDVGLAQHAVILAAGKSENDDGDAKYPRGAGDERIADAPPPETPAPRHQRRGAEAEEGEHEDQEEDFFRNDRDGPDKGNQGAEEPTGDEAAGSKQAESEQDAQERSTAIGLERRDLEVQGGGGRTPGRFGVG